jgi:phage major head subunit gpT-like protein
LTTASTLVNEAYRNFQHDQWSPKVSTNFPVASEVLIMGWMGIMPKMRGWFGPRVVNSPNPETYTVTPLPYENTYGLDRFKFDDDQYGIYYPLLVDFAQAMARWQNFETRDLLEATGLYSSTSRQAGLDGLSHWNTAHPVDVYAPSKGTFVNDFTGGGVSIGGVTVGGRIGVVSLTSMYEYMGTIKGQNNERLGVRPSHVMVPQNLRAEVDFLLKNQFMAPPTWGGFGNAGFGSQVGAADNQIRRFSLDYIVNEDLASASIWYLLDNTRAMKPFGWALRSAPTTTTRTNESDPIVFDTHTFAWGTWARACPTWTPAFLSARSGP